MTFADAAKVEAAFDSGEVQLRIKHVQTEFDTFQIDVMGPLHALISERVTKATELIEQLRRSLTHDAQASNPNQTQEEGDEQPELLEKLTLLKWLSETREQLHRELFELEGTRNEHYKAVVLTPYRLAGQTDKAREAESFFAHDGQGRRASFEKAALGRAEDLLDTVEANVSRGVEDQLCAFWDIAPGLLEVVHKVPRTAGELAGFDVLIPPAEVEENPAYADFPLQYLYSLLVHAEKSARQFVESQTNLLCLLHEVRTTVTVAGSRLLETQRRLAGEDVENVGREMAAVRMDEEGRLTADLKEKVSLVETQWREGLGQGLGECKENVEAFLTERGGWDEGLLD